MSSMEQATKSRDDAKSRMNSFKIGSKKWNDAEEDYEFWSNKVAMFDVMQKKGMIK